MKESLYYVEHIYDVKTVSVYMIGETKPKLWFELECDKEINSIKLIKYYLNEVAGLNCEKFLIKKMR